jgi:hypothetical protein
VTKSKSSPWLTGSGGLATGGRDFDRPSNFRIQRSALRAAADPARSPHVEHDLASAIRSEEQGDRIALYSPP